MNNDFKKYGVKVHHFTVRHVEMPSDMAQDKLLAHVWWQAQAQAQHS